MHPSIELLETRVLFSNSILPRPDHVVVLIEEDHSYSQILKPNTPSPVWAVAPPPFQNTDPGLRQLAANGASFTRAFSVGNNNFLDYQSIFSGYVPTQKEAPQGSPLTAPNLASELNAAGLSFGGYSEGLPSVGYTGSAGTDYSRSHNPWVEFANVPSSQNLPFSAFPSQFSKLPTVAFVVPNQQDNMHSGDVQPADEWFQTHIEPYAKWAMSHNSLLIVTWDESHQSNDQIPTIFYGPMVEPGNCTQRVTQLNILRTIEDMYGLAPTGRSVSAAPILGVFESSAQSSQERQAPGGVRDARIFGSVTVDGSPHLRGAAATVYLDLNNDGSASADEPHARVGPGGHFSFRHLEAGAYTVRAVPGNGYAIRGEASFAVSLVVGQKLTGVTFSVVPVA